MADPNRPLTEGLYGTRAPTPVAPLGQARTVNRSEMLFVGDSHTDAIQKAYDGNRDRGLPPATFRNGATASHWAPPDGAGWPRLMRALEQRPREVVVSLGTNDGANRRSAAAIQSDITNIVRAIRHVEATPTFILPPTGNSPDAAVNARIDAGRDVVRATLDRLGVGYIDLEQHRIEMQTGGSPPGVHATARGYGQIAELLRQRITANNFPR